MEALANQFAGVDVNKAQYLIATLCKRMVLSQLTRVPKGQEGSVYAQRLMTVKMALDTLIPHF